MNTREVIQLAIDAFEKIRRFEELEYGSLAVSGKAVAALKTELATPEPEPVAWMHPVHTLLIEPRKFDPDCIPLFRKGDL
jgi:hypothetical protein